MGNESDLLPVDAENELLRDNHTSIETTATTPRQDQMFTMMQNGSKSLGAMGDSLLAVNQLL